MRSWFSICSGRFAVDKAASALSDAALKYYVLLCALCGVYTEFGIHWYERSGEFSPFYLDHRLIMQFLLDAGGGDFRRPRQINNLALGLQEIKLSSPVIAHDKHIHIVFLHIGLLLRPALLWNH